MDENGRELSMDARGLDVAVEEFQARVAATEPGTYTLTWPTLHEIPANWRLILTDLETGTEVDLRTQPYYTFEVASATAERRSDQLGTLHPAQRTTSARFQISVSNVTTTGESPGAAPAAFALDEVYPNPFAAEATVRYSVARATDVRLTVYDLLGREVARLAEGPHEAGHHTAMLNGSNLASGVYFVRMNADGYAETKKVVILD
jgi:hypothetical protein